MDTRALIAHALEARKRSYSPYSGFAVGAALLTKDGRIFTGCNIESVSFSPTCCAERVAFFKAISEGVSEFEALAVVGGEKVSDKFGICPPCGVCRQVISEFCPKDFKIILADSNGEFEIYTLDLLLPLGFGK